MEKIKIADSINNDEDEEKMMPKNGILIDFYTMCVCVPYTFSGTK